MDKSWIIKPQSSIAYQKGIQEFIDFAFKGAKENDVVICPCKRCGFRKLKSRSDMFDHLSWSPFPQGYTMWIHHGESFVRSSTISPSTTPSMVEDTNIVEEPIQNMINDAFGVYGNHANEIPSASNLEIEQEDYVMPSSTQERNEAKEYYELAREGEQPLYEGCRRYSRLSFLVKLYHIKCLCGLSEKAMTMILELIKDAFEYANIPSSFYEAKKSITKLGLNYIKIPACPNGCMLYWGEDEERETCKNCNTSKWKTNEDVSVKKKKKKIPAKELWTSGVDTYDSFKKEMFKLHANLMWTISDFPGLGSLSGWNTYTGLACPSCNFQTTPLRLKASRKWCFMGHRRFLDRRHRFRLNKIRFNGEQEMRSPQRTLSGHEVFEKVKDVEVIFGKKAVKEKSVKRTREEQPIVGDSTQCDPTKEVKLGGPVHYRWMYPVERYLGKLKSYVRNKAKPEGSIAEGYRFEEILTFCSRYLENIETRWNQPGRVDDDPIDDIQTASRVAELFPRVGKPVGGSSYYTLTPTEKLQAHRHVLTNCPIVDDYLKQFRSFTQNQMRRSQRSATEIDKKIRNNLDNIHGPDKDVLISLAHGPFDKVKRFTTFNVNGFKFRTLERDNLLKTQNSGVFGMFGTRSYSSNSDTQMRFGGVPYYGRLIDIIMLSYDGFTVPMFKCEWANTINPRGIKIDKLGFTSINFARLLHTSEHEDNEPYIQASEAHMVFYVDDESEQGWSIPVHLKPRDLYDMGGNDEIMTPIEPYPSQNLEQIFSNDDLGTSAANDDNS
ncbi:unnamed protein product [Vicia faba]|uniref:Transposase-associated domain-containing protein n=1 Tax=Vicia faba TaxID=3906 RepID=A0AAV1AC61_VICFA|nr:unnamed protein product [Vicia faba]